MFFWKILFFWPLVMKTCVFGQNGTFFRCFFVNAKYYGPFLCQKYVFGKFCARSFQRYMTWGVNCLQHELERKNASKILLFIENHPNKESCVKLLRNEGFLTTQGRLSPPPYPIPPKRCSLERSQWKLFLHLSARVWTRIGLRMTKKHKK